MRVRLVDSGSVCNAEWLRAQGVGYVGCYVAPKADSGSDVLSVAPGAGVDGGDCLRVTAPDARAGLPGFWVIQGKATKAGVANIAQVPDAFIVRGQRANALAFSLKFDAGFQAESSRTSVGNFVVGTYHADPSVKGVKKETNNWHFYHQITLRHDRKNGGWFRVVINEVPQHQRGNSKYAPAPNPTHPIGNYWELLTRLYLECSPYFGKAEIDHPVSMLVDEMQLLELPEYRHVQIEFGAVGTLGAGKTTRIAVRAVNNTPHIIAGVIAHRSHYVWTPNLIDANTGKAVHTQRVNLLPGVNDFELLLTPRQQVPVGTRRTHSVVFVPADQILPEYGSAADNCVQLSQSRGISGATDSRIAFAAITTKTEY